MARRETPSYLFSSDDRLRRRAIARARARRRRRLALVALLLLITGALVVGWAAVGRGDSSKALHVGGRRETQTLQQEAAGTTTVRGSIPNESFKTTARATTVTAT